MQLDDTPFDAWIAYYERELASAVKRMHQALDQGDTQQVSFQEKVADWDYSKLNEYKLKKAEWLLLKLIK